ncbi:MAG TPA: hypothetical protein VGM67_19985 [Gemmatimonadaceae bacterium]
MDSGRKSASRHSSLVDEPVDLLSVRGTPLADWMIEAFADGAHASSRSRADEATHSVRGQARGA